MKLNKHNLFFYLSGIMVLAVPLFAQTTHWRLIWDKNTEADMDHYNVYRARHSSADSLLATVPFVPRQGTDTTMVFIDSSLSKGVRYFYRLKAVDAGGLESDFSDEVSAAIPKLNFPAELYLQAGTAKKINFYDYVIDPDNADATLRCTVSGNANIQVDVSTVNQDGSIRLTAPDPFINDEILTFTVMDPDSFFDLQKVVVHPLPAGSEDVEFSAITIQMAAVCTSVTMHWTTNVQTRDTVQYGQSISYGLRQAADSRFTTSHQVQLDGLEQGTMYHFKITATDENGMRFNSSDSSFSTCILSGAINVFPIPFRANHPKDGDKIHFTNLPEGSTLLIYNVLGDPVFSKNGLKGQFLWDAANNQHNPLHTGVYFFVIKQKGKKLLSDKLIIIR